MVAGFHSWQKAEFVCLWYPWSSILGNLAQLAWAEFWITTEVVLRHANVVMTAVLNPEQRATLSCATILVSVGAEVPHGANMAGASDDVSAVRTDKLQMPPSGSTERTNNTFHSRFLYFWAAHS